MKRIFILSILAFFVAFRSQGQVTVTVDTPACGASSTTLHGTLLGFTGTSSGITIDDIYSGVIGMGFSFNYYGTSSSNCVIGANGTICFTTSLAGGSDPWSITAALLGNASKRNNICAPWCDIDITNGGTITYATIGTSPNRKFIVNYCTAHMFSSSCSSQYTTSQAVLYESTNVIDIYIAHKTICTAWNGGYAICGIQNAAGTAATVATSRDYPTTWNATNEAWRFTPNSGYTAYTVGAIPFSPVPYSSSAIYWYDSTTGAYLGTGSSISVSTSGAHTFTAVALGCGDSTFTFVHLPVGSIGSPITGPTQVCVGNTITLSNAGTGGTWSSSATGIASVGASTGVVTGVSAGTAIITYNGATGCSDTALVTVNPLPATIGGPTVVCEGATITMTNTSTGGTWSTSSTSTATIGATTGVLTGVSTGTVTVTYTLPTGCYVTSRVTVNPLPNAGTLSGPATVCVGSSISLSTTVSGGSWSSSASGIASVSTSGTVYGISAGSATISYSVTNSCGTAVATYGITVIPLPNAGTISGPSSVCATRTITLTSTVSGGSWSSSSTSVATISTSGIVTGVSAGTVTITYSFTNACGTATTTKAVTVYPLPTIAVSPTPVAFCIGRDTVLTATGAVTYAWTPGSSLSTTAGSNVRATPVTTTTYTVTGTSADGCVNTGFATITVNPLPTIVAAPATVCRGTTATLTASGAINYTWNSPATLSSSAGTSVVASPSVTTTYTITGTDANGCVNKGTVMVTVNPIPSAPIVSSPVKYCLFDTPSPLVAVGAGLIWYPTSSGGSGSATAPTPTTSSVGSQYYYVSQTVSGCESPIATVQVDVNPNAKTNFDYTIIYGCAQDTVIFTNLSTDVDSLMWNFGDGVYTNDMRSPVVHAYAAAAFAQTYTVRLMGVNFQCADDSTSQVLNLLPTPPVTFLTGVTSSQEILYGTSIQLNAAGGVLYHWVPDDGSLSNNNINNPIATPRDSTRYIVYSYNEHGCLDTAYVDITVRHSDNDGYPTGFTPNGDGQNDEFRIPPGRVDRLVQFTIYNRWGEIVFQTNDKNKGWDGHHNGAPQDMGVYFYEIIVAHSDGANKMLKGSVTLIR